MSQPSLETVLADPCFRPWPGLAEAGDLARRRKLLEAYLGAARTLEAYDRSGRRRELVRRLGACRRQTRELFLQLSTLDRETGCLRVMQEAVRARSLAERSITERLENFLRFFRTVRHAVRGKALPPSRLASIREADKYSEVLETTCQVVRVIIDGLLRRGRLTSAEEAIGEIFFKGGEPWRILALAPDPMDDFLHWLERRATADELASSEWCGRARLFRPSRIREFENDRDRLERAFKRVLRDEDRLSGRVDRGIKAMLAPMEPRTANRDIDDAAILPVLLLALRQPEMALLFHKRSVVREMRRNLHNHPGFLVIARHGRLSEEFWWFALRALLRRTGALDDDGAAAPWMREVLLLLLCHPASLGRAAVARGAEKARTALARQVAPLAHMTRPEDRTFDPAELERQPPEELIAAAARLLAQRNRDGGRAPLDLPDAAERSYTSLLEETILPLAHELLLALSAAALRVPAETGLRTRPGACGGSRAARVA